MVEQSNAALQCRGLVKRFGELTAVDGVELTLRPGECFGLLGPNGAGKTTTIEMLEGLSEPDGGTIEVLGLPWGGRHDREIKERIGVQLQDNQIADKLTVWEVLVLFRSLYDKGRDPEQVLSWFELEGKRHTRFHRLSGGQKQRLTLACALVSDPELLFLDEPTTGLDPQARQKVWQLVNDFKQQGGTALLTTHYMEEAAYLCDRLAIMDHGKVIARGSPDELIASLGVAQIIEFQLRDPAVHAGAESIPAGEDSGLSAGARSRLSQAMGELQRRGPWWVAHSTRVGESLTALLAVVGAANLELVSLRTHEPTLDDVFLHLTGKELRDV